MARASAWSKGESCQRDGSGGHSKVWLLPVTMEYSNAPIGVLSITLEPPFRAQNRGRGDWIRTSDLLNPIQVRYQAALRPDRWRSHSLPSGHP
jgi:hypothetical protein